MVPQETSRLAVGVVIIFILTGEGQVLRPTVERGTRRRSVKMDGAFTIAMINKSDDRLNATGYDDGRARRGSVVADETSRFLARIDLLSEGLDIHLIHPDFLVGHRIEHFSMRHQLAHEPITLVNSLLHLSDRRDGKSNRVQAVCRTLLITSLPGGWKTCWIIFNNACQSNLLRIRDLAGETISRGTALGCNVPSEGKGKGGLRKE